MNSPEFRTNWKLLRNHIRNQWPDLSDRELDRIDGRPNRLYHALIQKHGISRDEAARELWEFFRSARQHNADTATSH